MKANDGKMRETDTLDKKELESRVANFHATLLIEKIKQLNIADVSKKKILELILKDEKEKHTNN